MLGVGVSSADIAVLVHTLAINSSGTRSLIKIIISICTGCFRRRGKLL